MKRFILSMFFAIAPTALLAQNIAIVNGQSIPKSRYDFILKMVKEESQASGQPLAPNVETLIKNHMIQNAVRVHAAEAKKLQLTPDYAEMMIQAREKVLTDLLFKQYMKDHPVNDSSVRAEYDRVAKARNQEYHAKHILVKTESEAKQIQLDLKNGKTFESLAEKYSQDPGSAKQGGDLGWASPENYVPEFAAALRQLRKGETTSTPVKTTFGYHIVRLDDIRSANFPAFDSVKMQIKEDMQKKQINAFQEYLKSLQTNAKIQ